MRGVPRARARDLVRAVRRHADAEHAGAAVDDQLELGRGVEVEPHRDAEAVAQRIGQQPGARRRADQREGREVDLDRARRRPLADDEVELEILHRRIEDLLDRRIEPMDLVDEQHVARLEIGEQRREVAGLGDHRPRGRAETDAELARDDLRQRRLAEAGRADEQHVVERLAAALRGRDEDARFARACSWPMNSASRCGRSDGLGGVFLARSRRRAARLQARRRAHLGAFTSPAPEAEPDQPRRLGAVTRPRAAPRRSPPTPAAGRSRD